ncbi:PspC domain-containing protein [Lachnospiraceae bacterium JLR.KK008]
MNNDYKRLTRSKTSRMLCGVCGGIGEYLKLDPTVIRLLWILFVFFSLGMAVLIYFIAAVIIPDEE